MTLVTPDETLYFLSGEASSSLEPQTTLASVVLLGKFGSYFNYYFIKFFCSASLDNLSGGFSED